MSRPLLLRLTPKKFRAALWMRLYRSSAASRPELYRNAKLAYAPQVSMDLVPGDVVSGCIAYTGLWERRITERVMKIARQGGTFVDVGANLGYYSLLWAAAHPENKGYAFEASPRVYPLFLRNLERNGFSNRVKTYQLAAGAQAGQLPFEVGPADEHGWGGLAKTKTANTMLVDVVRVDEILNEPIELLKIDVEGAEPWVLEGCTRLFERRLIRQIIFEENKSRSKQLGLEPAKSRELLKQFGFQVTPLGDPDKDLDWLATLDGK
ncbi:MAG: FkbM family methyltransferase [Gemmataceae bacterium]